MRDLSDPNMADHSVTHLSLEQQARWIVERITPWSGSEGAAWAWYHNYPIAALGGRTPQQLVKDRHADDLLEYLSHADRGGYS
ncbi:hypothetical protein LOKO_02495 [Halomonas chromatireducens]|uniref:Antitoxin Xre/MbcA/ParS-like toxin-binding domain-containing protein n=1 Tax=Halomonas chromatireducens TaxID=507626 RepID=A0A0X8HFD4_9GAMM|nr:hypothetical protein LOKO_02495 [Halomonas chromatireducens]